MPGDKYASIQHPRQYRALRRRGFSKEAAARISNARTPGHRVKTDDYPDQAQFAGYTMEDWDDTKPDSFYHDTRRAKASGTTGLAIPPTGPSALFNQPGVGIRSMRRRRRLKEFNWGAQVGQVISGNLTRGEGGRFSGSGGPSARQTLSASQRKRRDEVRAKREARAAERAAAHEQELVAEEGTRAEEDEYIASGATGRERQRRRAEIAAKRRQRSTQRREARRQEAAAERAARQQEDEAEQATRAEEGQPKGGGGGGKAKPGDAEKQAEQAKKKADNRKTIAPKAGLRAEEADALAAVAEGGTVDEAQIDGLAELGLVTSTGDNQFEATDAGRRALAALERGDVRGALAAIQDGKAKLARDAARSANQQARDEAAKKRDAERSKRERERGDAQKKRENERTQRDARRAAERSKRAAERTRRESERDAEKRRREQQGRERTPILAAQIIRNLAERRQRRRKEMTLKAKRPRAADEEKAMFANMGGGGKGGGGGGGGGSGGGGAWKKGPDGKRHPSAAQVDSMQAKLDADKAKLDKNPPDDRVALLRARSDIKSRQFDIDEHRERALNAFDKNDHGLRNKRREIIERQRRVTPNTQEQRYLASYLNEIDAAIQHNKRERRKLAAAGKSFPRVSFAVFKDAAGHDRWAAITTTAYKDKDGEWISREAIRAVVAAGDAGQPRGPLRFWHVPGLDLGDCDYQAALGDGRLLLESGTFRSKAAAQIGAQAARRGYQMSPGFVHTRHEPRGGVFNAIALFERSFVPPGRASNPYTRLLTKETRMLTEEKKKEFEALAGDAEGRALLTQLLSQAETTTKALDAAGAVYKDAPEWAQDLDRRLKAFEAKAPMPAEEMMEAGATEMADGVEELADETVDDTASDLLDDEGFADLIVSKLLAQLGPLLEIEKKMASWAGEIKAALPQMAQQAATKDDARAKEIADLTARLKSLEGDQPRRGNLIGGVWGDLTGIPVTKEQAERLTAQQPGAQVPADLTPQEQGAYQMLWGNE